jgi:histidyl-tRNA synthetase
MGKVWRYDRPAAGRYREFYQADADIIGSHHPDCEVDLLLLATTVLREFGLTDYRLVINHRKLLEAQVRKAGIPADKKADALRALDKFDKIGHDGVLGEAVGYGIEREPFAAFLTALGLRQENGDGGVGNSRAYLAEVARNLAGDSEAEAAVKTLDHVFARAAALGFDERLVLDPTLARGLDYYTGTIFEAKARVEGTLLSFAGGGRYDDLIGLYGGMPQGAVGFSFGVERLISLLQERGAKLLGLLPRPVLVAPVGSDMGAEAERIATRLRDAGIAARLGLSATAPGKHLQYAEATHLEWVIFVGEAEVQAGRFPLRHLPTRSEDKLTPDEILSHLAAKLAG